MSNPPPAKKKKITEAPPQRLAPIVFKAAGMKCDTRLLVFGQEFQVHSMVLKLHSAFFRKFMDSPDKQNQAQDGFRYNWSTLADEGGSGWHLISNNEYNKPCTYETFVGDSEGQQTRFRELLCAFYNTPYVVSSIAQLSELSDFADYYGCLRVLSATLSAAILATPDKVLWYSDMRAKLELSTNLALKLRNPTLFRDAFIFSVALWQEPKYMKVMTDPKTRKIAEREHNKMVKLIATFHQYLLERRGGLNSEWLDLAAKASTRASSVGIALPRYLRLALAARLFDNRLPVRKVAVNLVKNNLAFEHEDLRAGWNDKDHEFYCARIDDSELPWDVNEEDW